MVGVPVENDSSQNSKETATKGDFLQIHGYIDKQIKVLITI